MPWQYACECGHCHCGAAGFSDKPIEEPFPCLTCLKPMAVKQHEIPKDHPGFGIQLEL